MSQEFKTILFGALEEEMPGVVRRCSPTCAHIFGVASRPIFHLQFPLNAVLNAQTGKLHAQYHRSSRRSSLNALLRRALFFPGAAVPLVTAFFGVACGPCVRFFEGEVQNYYIECRELNSVNGNLANGCNLPRPQFELLLQAH